MIISTLCFIWFLLFHCRYWAWGWSRYM